MPFVKYDRQVVCCSVTLTYALSHWRCSCRFPQKYIVSNSVVNVLRSVLFIYLFNKVVQALILTNLPVLS